VSATSETFWNKRSRKYEDRIKKRGSVYDKTIDRTRSLLADSDVVLDFGCASGEMTLDMASHVRQVRGIDSSGKMIELAKQKALDRQVDNVTFDQADAFDHDLAESSFSAIVAFNIFHLLDDAPEVLARLRDLLAPGGLLISETPCLGEWSWLLRSLIGLAQKVGFAPTIRSFTVPELESFVSREFEILETEIWDEKNKIQWIVARKARSQARS
jgi:2-polyprenyl-3-methyl-5-hydroxy-6-metoxy-1,4-benzoquinol methylase